LKDEINEEGIKMLSRRKLITAGASAGAISLIGSPLVKAGAGQASSPESSDVNDYLAVTPSSDSSFDSKLGTLFPGLLDDPIFQKIKSHAILITNLTQHKISAYSTHWKVTTATGGYETVLQHYFHPSANLHKSAHYGMKGNKARFTGKVPLHSPGTTRLVTPYFNWNASCYRNNPNPNWQKIIEENVSREFFLQELSNATAVQVNVDAIIVNEKSLVGPGAAALARTFRITRNAEHDEALSVSKYIAGGASMKKVKTFLKKHMHQALPSRNPPNHYLYCSVRRRQAVVLLRRLVGVEQAHFLRTINYLKKRPKTTVGLIGKPKN
jgi:hypothetical protein